MSFKIQCKFLDATEVPEKPKSLEEGLQDIAPEPKKYTLTSAEELFVEIRDKNFNAVGPVLSKKAKMLSALVEASIFLFSAF